MANRTVTTISMRDFGNAQDFFKIDLSKNGQVTVPEVSEYFNAESRRFLNERSLAIDKLKQATDTLKKVNDELKRADHELSHANHELNCIDEKIEHLKLKVSLFSRWNDRNGDGQISLKEYIAALEQIPLYIGHEA